MPLNSYLNVQYKSSARLLILNKPRDTCHIGALAAKSYMKDILILTILILAGIEGISQDIDKQEVLQKALNGGIEMSEAFKIEEYDKFLDFMHPKIINLMGGKEKLKEIFKNGLGPGIEIIKTELTLPNELIIQDSIYQCSFPQKLFLKVDRQKMYPLSSLIGISYDAGESWYYIGVSGNPLSKLRQQFPELSNDLKS